MNKWQREQALVDVRIQAYYREHSRSRRAFAKWDAESRIGLEYQDSQIDWLRAWTKANPQEGKPSHWIGHKGGTPEQAARYWAWIHRRQAACDLVYPDREAMRKRRRRARRRLVSLRRNAILHSARGEAYVTPAMIAGRWAMWGGRCYICGAPATATDHVIPLARGGTHWPANLRPICTRCNSSKGIHWPIEQIKLKG